MDSLFIPPSGAMQFQLLPRPRHQCTPEGMPTVKAKVFWVRQPVSNRMGCPCAMVYPIILESLPPGSEEAVSAYRQRYGMKAQIVTCNCQGRLIE